MPMSNDIKKGILRLPSRKAWRYIQRSKLRRLAEKIFTQSKKHVSGVPWIPSIPFS